MQENSSNVIILVLIMVCLVGLLIYAILKIRNSGNEEAPETTDTDSEWDTGKREPGKRFGPVEKTPSQTTLYAYYCTKQKKRCALCDGENDLSATQCCICGRPLR